MPNFSHLCSAHDFIRQAAVPFPARGIASADTVVAVMDGADWLQELIDAHCPQAIRILDFPHAASYLAKAAHAAFGAGSREASDWLDTWVSRLKTKTPRKVLAAVRALPMPDAAAEEVRDQVLGCLGKRRAQMAYAQFQAAGYPMGSGMVESANKLVVEARLKGSGMPWARKNVTPMLALRGIVCSGQWETAWPAIWQELRRQEVDKRRQRRDERRVRKEHERHEQVASVLTSLPPASPPAPTMVDGRPTDDHYWRTHPYDPALLAKAQDRAAAKP